MGTLQGIVSDYKMDVRAPGEETHVTARHKPQEAFPSCYLKTLAERRAYSAGGQGGNCLQGSGSGLSGELFRPLPSMDSVLAGNEHKCRVASLDEPARSISDVNIDLEGASCKLRVYGLYRKC
jgi:hypothetical protein